MPPKKPPLEAVRTVRAALADAARDRLATEVAAEARAEATAAQAREAERRARVEAMAAEAREREALTNPREFAQHAAFGLGLERRLATLAAEAAAAQTSAREAALRTTEARAALGAARAELDVVERHQEKVRHDAEAQVEAQVGEQAEEAHAARPRTGRR